MKNSVKGNEKVISESLQNQDNPFQPDTVELCPPGFC